MESSLVERARAGDADAFDRLVRERIDAVYRTALAIMGNPADARDATQEAFIAAWRALPRLRDTDRFDAWLGRICVNACRMAKRRRKGVRELVDPNAPEHFGCRRYLGGRTMLRLAAPRAIGEGVVPGRGQRRCRLPGPQTAARGQPRTERRLRGDQGRR
ncbi:hypothetical protein BH23CHL7_BH23CHL7_01110 [soil metagenome]